MNLLFDGEYTFLPVANQIAQTEDKTVNKLEDYTNQQLLLAEENSIDVSTTSSNSKVYIKYIFSDKSSLKFLVKATKE